VTTFPISAGPPRIPHEGLPDPAHRRSNHGAGGRAGGRTYSSSKSTGLRTAHGAKVRNAAAYAATGAKTYTGVGAARAPAKYAKAVQGNSMKAAARAGGAFTANLPGGKKYVGMTANPEARIAAHHKGASATRNNAPESVTRTSRRRRPRLQRRASTTRKKRRTAGTRFAARATRESLRAVLNKNGLLSVTPRACTGAQFTRPLHLARVTPPLAARRGTSRPPAAPALRAARGTCCFASQSGAHASCRSQHPCRCTARS
jgi:predicted GIY-YIG superfamily endonuclease